MISSTLDSSASASWLVPRGRQPAARGLRTRQATARPGRWNDRAPAYTYVTSSEGQPQTCDTCARLEYKNVTSSPFGEQTCYICARPAPVHGPAPALTCPIGSRLASPATITLPSAASPGRLPPANRGSEEITLPGRLTFGPSPRGRPRTLGRRKVPSPQVPLPGLRA